MDLRATLERLDRRLWPGTDDERLGVRERAEARMAKAMTYVRLAMVPIQFVPLLGPLPHPLLVLLAAVAACGEAFWLYRHVRRRRTLVGPVLIWGDIGFCLALIVTSRLGAGTSELMNRALPFALVSAGFVGFGFGFRRSGLLAVSLLASVWTSTALVNGTVKLVSDALGFYLWYAATTLTGREFRDLADATARAQVESARRQEELAERTREADVARERELMHREIHDHLLPIVDLVGSGKGVNGQVVALAAREAARARRLIVDGRSQPAAGLDSLLADIRDTYIEAGLRLTTVLRIMKDPPSDLGEVLAHATREALCNVLKYAQRVEDVNLYAESTEAGVEIVVRDRGIGFDTQAIVPGGGFTQTFAAVRRRGGAVTVESQPGHGTKVNIRWRP